MKHCVLFPLRAGNTKITGMYGRSIYDIEGKKHYYLPDRKGLFPYHPESTTTHLALTESVIDACSLLQYTDHTVLALYGTNGLTDEHLQAIKALKDLREATLFFDGERLAVRLWRLSVPNYRLSPKPRSATCSLLTAKTSTA